VVYPFREGGVPLKRLIGLAYARRADRYGEDRWAPPGRRIPPAPSLYPGNSERRCAFIGLLKSLSPSAPCVSRAGAFFFAGPGRDHDLQAGCPSGRWRNSFGSCGGVRVREANRTAPSRRILDCRTGEAMRRLRSAPLFL